MRRIAAVFLLAILPWPAAALAEPSGLATREVTWTLSTLAGTGLLRLEGYRPAGTLDLVLLPGWLPAANGKLSLEYRISDLVYAQAALTVRLNERSVGSALFPDRSGVLTFELPAGLFRPGSNVLTLEAFLPLDGDSDAFVADHPARWLEFGAESQIRLTVQAVDTPLVIADFPTYFEALGDDTAALVTFVLPDQPGDDELSAMAAVAFALQRASATHPQWNVISASRFEPGTLSGPAILIGSTGRIGPLDRLAPDGAGQSAWVRLARPEWSGGQIVLAIGGADGQAVLRAAQSLLDPAALLQMGSEAATIETLPARTPRPPAAQITLAELGYGTRMVRGVGQHSLIYSFDLPFDWAPTDVKLTADVAHAALLDPNSATLTVLLNGSTAFDIRLDAPEAIPHRVEMSLPRGLLRPGRNYLRMTFDLGIPASPWAAGTEDQSWASVRADTALHVPHTNGGGRTDLSDFPELFGSQVDLAALTVVLPAQSTDADLADALGLVRVLSLPGNLSGFAPRLVHAESVTPELLRSHLLVLGEAQRQPLLDDLANYLLLRFDRATASVERSFGVRVPTDSAELGIIQLIRSPWKKNRLILTVGGTSAQGYQEALGLLTAPASAPRLSGNLVAVSRGSGQAAPGVYSQPLADVGAVPGVGAAERLLGRFLDANGPWPMLILISASLLLLGVPIALIRSRRAKAVAASAEPGQEN